MKEIWVVNDFAGAQNGSAANPFVAKTAAEFDALLASLRPTDSLAHRWEGSFKTRGVYRWGKFASRNLGKDWTVDGAANVSLDSDAITDRDSQPLFCLAGPARSVKGITVRGNHSSLANGWQGSLRTGGVLLYGQALIDGVTFKDFGAIGAETFVAEIVGSGDITDSLFTDFDPQSSDDQVTVFRTIASENGELASTVRAIHEHNTTNAPGSKLVQAHTIYQSPGLIRFNKSVGADVLYYGDYFNNRDITIEENDADACLHGVQLKLSPTPRPQADSFSHENYTIGPNRFRSSGANVSLDTCGPSTSTRFIRRIAIDAGLSLENAEYGGLPGAANITRTGLPDPARKGCNPLARLFG